MIKTHSCYNPLYTDKEKFIILITGGRGSGKSFSASTFIERLTFELNRAENHDKIVHNILYSRYTMTSAAISIIPEVMEKIELDGTARYFSSTKTDIVNHLTGSRIMFRGIHTSSGNQTAKLKSIHGVTTFVVDEAEEWVDPDDYEKIMLSIRQKGIQNRVIVIMNPADSNHFIYDKYIKDTHRIEYFDGVPVQISTHPNVLHIHTTYLDNIEHLSPEFLKEVRDMKERAPERYAHVVMGQWADVAEGAVFKNFGIVDEFPEWCDKVAYGLDFGYTHDPTACVKCGIVGDNIYLDEQFYETGLMANDLIERLQKLGGIVYSESADPRLIDEISLGGIVIYPVQKGAGSVVAGIEGLKTFNIFVTRRSLNVQHEMRNYVWAKDKNGNYINLPEDKNNHLMDAWRYWYNGCVLGKTIVSKVYSKEELGIY